MEMVFHEDQDLYANLPYSSARNAAIKKRSGEDSKVPAAVPGAEDVKKSSCRAAAVFLGLLCLLLLIGLITLVSRFTKSNSKQEMAMVQLQTNYHNLTKEKDQLNTSYNNLTRQKDQLQTSYNQLTTEKDQLQERFEALQKKLQDIEASFKSLTEERAVLKRMLNDFGGWVHFSGSFYHISSTSKTWQQSRDDCLQKHADLMIINSKAEQDFANQFKKQLWIGLTDSETEGTWKWVDGTPMTKSYWRSGEPNGGRSENCGEIRVYSAENSWNDLGCSKTLFGICEKKFLP